MINKYRVHEVAKDFDVPSKSVLEILNKHFDGQKKSMTALEETELDVIFEVYTKENSVENFDAYFATANEPKKEEKAAEPAKEEKAEKKSTDAPAEKGKAKDKKPENAKQEKAPEKVQQPQNTPKKKEKDPNAKPQSRTKGEARTVDTRANNVDLEKYNERYENIAPANRGVQNDKTVNKQKLKQKSQQYRKQGMRSSRRETEAERLKRIAAERAKKPQLKIQVPDEITVGGLAELLHMTAAEVIKSSLCSVRWQA